MRPVPAPRPSHTRSAPLASLVALIGLLTLLAGCHTIGNDAPSTPTQPNGTTAGDTCTLYRFSASSTDPDGDKVLIRFDWRDGDVSDWLQCESVATGSHRWSAAGLYHVRAQARDEHGARSAWSPEHEVAVSHALTWAVVVGGAEDDFGHSVATTADGGYVIAGTTMSWGAGHADAFLVKVGPTGDTAWLRTYGGGRGHEDGNCVEQTADGGYALAGETGSFGIGSYDVWLVRADVNGNQLWQTCFGKVNSRSYGFSVLEHEDGSVLIAGALGTNLFLAKTTATGESLWGAVYEHSVWDECRGACRVSDGGYVLVGSAYGGQSRGNDILLLKADASGVLLWDTVFGGTGADVGWSVQQTSDGGFVIAGVTESAGAGSWDACLVKTDAAGNETWTKTYGGPGRDYARSVQQTRDGGFILTGCTESQGAGAGDVYVIKTDAQGNPTWMRTYGGTGADEGRSVRQTADGGYIIAGSTRSFGVGGSDIYIIKTDSAGTSENAVLSKVRRAGQTR